MNHHERTREQPLKNPAPIAITDKIIPQRLILERAHH